MAWLKVLIDLRNWNRFFGQNPANEAQPHKDGHHVRSDAEAICCKNVVLTYRLDPK